MIYKKKKKNINDKKYMIYEYFLQFVFVALKNITNLLGFRIV